MQRWGQERPREIGRTRGPRARVQERVRHRRGLGRHLQISVVIENVVQGVGQPVQIAGHLALFRHAHFPRIPVKKIGDRFQVSLFLQAIEEHDERFLRVAHEGVIGGKIGKDEGRVEGDEAAAADDRRAGRPFPGMGDGVADKEVVGRQTSHGDDVGGVLRDGRLQAVLQRLICRRDAPFVIDGRAEHVVPGGRRRCRDVGKPLPEMHQGRFDGRVIRFCLEKENPHRRGHL